MNQLLDKISFCVIDVETTGLSPRFNRVIEIGVVKIQNLKITDKKSYLINPMVEIPSFITSLTGITNRDVRNAPRFDEIADEIIEFTRDSILAGHNFSFDLSFLNSEFMLSGRELLIDNALCTLKLARRLFPELKSKSLSSVSKHLNIRNRNAHRALGDAEVTARILIKMISKLKDEGRIKSLDDIFEYLQTGITSSSLKIKKELQSDYYSLPNAPGIYYFTNSRGKIIYIGKAKSIKERVKSYFATNTDRKTKRIITQAKRLHHKITNTELTALLAEAESIKLINPKHNKQLKKYGNKYFLVVKKNYASPKIEITNSFDFDGNDYFGLYFSRKKAESVLEIINKTFAIRECNEKEFGKRKRCFLFEIERCTGPCISEPVSLKETTSELNKVYEFLYGRNQHALDRLLNKMKEFSAKQKYERAAEIKHTIDLIMDQTHKTSLLAEPVNKANILIEALSDFENDYLLMINCKIYIKNYLNDKSNLFEQALDEYFEGTINLESLPADEDLEKMKIILNWIIKNRNKIKIHYLRNYQSKEELFAVINNKNDRSDSAIDYNIAEPIYDYNIDQ